MEHSPYCTGDLQWFLRYGSKQRNCCQKNFKFPKLKIASSFAPAKSWKPEKNVWNDFSRFCSQSLKGRSNSSAHFTDHRRWSYGFCNDSRKKPTYSVEGTCEAYTQLPKIILHIGPNITSSQFQICGLYEVPVSLVNLIERFPLTQRSCFNICMGYLFLVNCEVVLVLCLAIDRLLCLIRPVR